MSEDEAPALAGGAFACTAISTCTGASQLRAGVCTATQSAVSHSASTFASLSQVVVKFVLSAVVQAATFALLLFVTTTKASAASTASLGEKPAGLSYVQGTRWFKPHHAKVDCNQLKTAVNGKLEAVADEISPKVPKKVQMGGVMAGSVGVYMYRKRGSGTKRRYWRSRA